MTHRINRETFLNLLGRVQPGLSKKGTLEQSKAVVFQDSWAYAFNGEICVRTQSGLPDDITGAVAAEPLMRWVEAINDDEIDIAIKDNQFTMKAGRKKSAVRLEAEITLALEDVSLPESWTLLPEDFSRAVEQTEITAAGTTEEFKARCIHIHPEYLESCDKRQATRFMVRSGVTESFLVLAETLSQMVPLGLTKIGTTPDWVHFRNKTLIFSCRRHMDDYPTDGVTRLLSFEGTPAILPKGAEVAAKIASVFANGKDDKLVVKLTPGRMTVYGGGPQGWAEEELDISYDGEAFAFRIKAQHLSRLVKAYDACQLSDGRLKVVGDKWSFVSVLGKSTEGKEKPPREAVTVPADDEDSDGDYGSDDDE